MTVLYAIFTALLQGIAEFLPVSSSGHLAVIENLTNASADVNAQLLFIAFLHLGSLVAVLFSFRRDVGAILGEIAVLIRGRDGAEHAPLAPAARLAFLVVAATAPMLLAVPLYGAVRLLFTKTAFIGVMMIASGVLLYVVTRYITAGKKTERTFTLLDAVLVGAAQLVALIPGLSRTGATIAVALTRGADRNFAIKLSYLSSVPAVLGVVIATVVGALRNDVPFAILPISLLGMIISAVVGVFAIGFLREMMSKKKFELFGYYNMVAGTLAIILSLIF